jgi:hypothetical protein
LNHQEDSNTFQRIRQQKVKKKDNLVNGLVGCKERERQDGSLVLMMMSYLRKKASKFFVSQRIRSIESQNEMTVKSSVK